MRQFFEKHTSHLFQIWPLSSPRGRGGLHAQPWRCRRACVITDFSNMRATATVSATVNTIWEIAAKKLEVWRTPAVRTIVAVATGRQRVTRPFILHRRGPSVSYSNVTSSHIVAAATPGKERRTLAKYLYHLFRLLSLVLCPDRHYNSLFLPPAATP